VTRIVLPSEPLVEAGTALRPWRDADLTAVVAACRDAEIARWTTLPENYGESDARAFLLHRYDAMLTGSAAPLAVVSPEDRLLGSIALMRFDWDHRRCEVGYWLGREARGHGHATRALRLICGWGFATLSLERIALYAATGNRASQLVAERAGFAREATLRAYMRGKGEQLDMVVYALLSVGLS
jgi:RimJ/RimL family protein N-acetyltransferase